MMKKLFILTCALFTMTSLSAQRIAVLEFSAGTGVSQADVDGISAIFCTYFSPNGYTLVERTQIDKVIDEQNFQRGKLTQEQMVRIGQILNISKVVIGNVNIIMNQYNLDIRVVNVESGTIAAKDGETWGPGSSYRTMMSNLATRLADKIAITPIKSSKPIPTTNSSCEIKYTSADNGIITPNNLVFGSHIVSNTYENGEGKIVFGGNIIVVGAGAFKGCNLTSIVIPDGVISIEEDAFSGCSNLTSVSIPNSVVSIGDSAFANCISLIAIVIPNSVTSIGICTFSGCKNLRMFYGKFASADNRCIVLNGELKSFAPVGLTEYIIPDGVTSIAAGTFAYCDSLTSVIIPNSVTKIEEGAFLHCSSLKRITIPNNVTEIGTSTFVSCSSLTSVTIGNSVTSIGNYAFLYCSNLISITIPDSVTSIGDGAFAECSSLKSVYCKPTTPPTGSGNMFSYWFYNYYKPLGCKIYVPRNSVDLYKSAVGWNNYASYIVGYDF